MLCLLTIVLFHNFDRTISSVVIFKYLEFNVTFRAERNHMVLPHVGLTSILTPISCNDILMGQNVNSAFSEVYSIHGPVLNIDTEPSMCS